MAEVRGGGAPGGWGAAAQEGAGAGPAWMPHAGRRGEHHQGGAGGRAGAGHGGAAARSDQRLRPVRARRDA
eukprot:3700553-Alexandrium_andersonii.AAC.1